MQKFATSKIRFFDTRYMIKYKYEIIEPEVKAMQKYQVEINETLSRVVEIEAENESDAISKIKDLYRQEKIVLDSDDYLDTEIKIYEE